jgi:predicted ATP-grasp superfamily ATP-dependent carboligase
MDHHGALGVMRSLGRLGVKVYGLHATPNPVASYSKYCQGVFEWNLDDASQEKSVEYLIQVAKTIGGRPLLVATNDETAIFIAQNAEALKKAFVFQFNSPEIVHSLYDKKAMYFVAKQLGIPTAETLFPKSRLEILDFSENVQFPLMLKASDNIVISRRSGRKMAIVHSKAELLREYELMEDRKNPSLMLQEYIPGKDDSVWMFNGYFDEHSEMLFGLTGRKIHQTPIHTGMTALGICLANSTVQAQTEKLVKALGYRGILDIGFRYDARDGQYKLLDANPRLGATFRLFVGEDGMDVVRAHYLHFTGQPVPVSSICEGRKWIVEDADLISCIRYYRDRALTLADWVKGYHGIQEGAWFAKDDLRPFFRILASSCAKPFRKVARSVASGSPRLSTSASRSIHASQ